MSYQLVFFPPYLSHVSPCKIFSTEFSLMHERKEAESFDVTTGQAHATHGQPMPSNYALKYYLFYPGENPIVHMYTYMYTWSYPFRENLSHSVINVLLELLLEGPQVCNMVGLVGGCTSERPTRDRLSWVLHLPGEHCPSEGRRGLSHISVGRTHSHMTSLHGTPMCMYIHKTCGYT